MWRRKKEYEVEPQGHAGLIYREGDRSADIFSERLVDDEFDVVVYLSRTTHWDPPHEHEQLTDSDRERIKARIQAALKVKIEWD